MIVINETWRLAPWADVLYACDFRWWRSRSPAEAQFAGLRVQGFLDAREGLWPRTVHAGVQRGNNVMLWHGDQIGAGGNSGFQAVNFAARTGARRIILLGYDMGHDGSAHWHGDHAGGLSNPDQKFLQRCACILDEQAKAIAARGIEVINASRKTRLRQFRRMSIDEALAEA